MIRRAASALIAAGAAGRAPSSGNRASTAAAKRASSSRVLTPVVLQIADARAAIGFSCKACRPIDDDTRASQPASRRRSIVSLADGDSPGISMASRCRCDLVAWRVGSVDFKECRRKRLPIFDVGSGSCLSSFIRKADATFPASVIG